MGNLIRRLWAAEKLRRGRCIQCRHPLRDDQRGYCSEECREDHSLYVNAW